MLIKTKYFGPIEIKRDAIISFKDGIIGFPEEKEYVLLGQVDINSPFQFLQSITNEHLCFIVIPPFFFRKQYAVDLDEYVIDELKIEDEKDVMIYAIVVVADKLEKSTANLKAPLIINMKSRRAKQIILENTDYKIRHYLFTEMQELNKREVAASCSY